MKCVKLYEVIPSCVPPKSSRKDSFLPLFPYAFCLRNVLINFAYSPGKVVAGLTGGTEVRD